MGIRETTADDLDAVLDVERRAFGREVEVELTRQLLADPTAEPRLSLLAFEEGRAVGHVLFTAATLEDASQPVTCANLAPLAVVPERQRAGIGGRLTEEGLKRLGERGVDLVFVLGHPTYYPRFGFEPAHPRSLMPPYPIRQEHADAWMVRALREGLLGAVTGRVRCADPLMRPEDWGQ